MLTVTSTGLQPNLEGGHLLQVCYMGSRIPVFGLSPLPQISELAGSRSHVPHVGIGPRDSNKGERQPSFQAKCSPHGHRYFMVVRKEFKHVD